MNSSEDIRKLAKWLNEEQTAPIDREALARVLAAMQSPPVVNESLTTQATNLALDELKHIKQKSLSELGISLVDEKVLAALAEALAKQDGQSNFCPNCEALARELKAAKQDQGEPDYWLGYGLQAHTEKPFEGATPVFLRPQPAKSTAEQEQGEDAQVKCKWCNGHGVMAGHAHDGSFDGEVCQHCNHPAPQTKPDLNDARPLKPQGRQQRRATRRQPHATEQPRYQADGPAHLQR